MKNKIFERALSKVPNYIDLFARNSIDIIDEVQLILNTKNWSQKDLARKMGKSESEISKWLSGGHNITLKTISKLEDILGEKIIMTKSKSMDFLDLNSIENNLNCLKLDSVSETGSFTQHTCRTSFGQTKAYKFSFKSNQQQSEIDLTNIEYNCQ